MGAVQQAAHRIYACDSNKDRHALLAVARFSPRKEERFSPGSDSRSNDEILDSIEFVLQVAKTEIISTLLRQHS